MVSVDEQIIQEEIAPIFQLIDLNKSGIVSWTEFCEAIMRLLVSTGGIEIFEIGYDLGFGLRDQIAFDEFLGNVFLADYGGDCSIFDSLAAKLSEMSQSSLPDEGKVVLNYMESVGKVRIQKMIRKVNFSDFSSKLEPSYTLI